MQKHDHLRRKAIELRQRHALSLDEIVERLQLPKTTIYYWIKDIPLQRSTRPNVIRASEVNRENARLLREAAYQEGWEQASTLLQEPTFRDFVVLYMAEGYKRSRNEASICNSDPKIVKLAHYWLKRFARNKLYYYIQYHVDQDLNELKIFWSETLDIDPEKIWFQRKSNSGQMVGRNWRSVYGVLQVKVADTYLRAKIGAWMEYVKYEWDNFLGA